MAVHSIDVEILVWSVDRVVDLYSHTSSMADKKQQWTYTVTAPKPQPVPVFIILATYPQ